MEEPGQEQRSVIFPSREKCLIFSLRYLRITRDGDFKMELGADYIKRVTAWEEIMNKYNFSFNLN